MTKSWNDLADLQEPDYSTYNNLLIIDANNLSYRWLQRPNYASFGADFIRTVQSLSKSYEASRTPHCQSIDKVYHFAWHSLQCGHCKQMTNKFDYLMESKNSGPPKVS